MIHAQSQTGKAVLKKIRHIRRLKSEIPLYSDVLGFYEPVWRERMQYKARLMPTIERPAIGGKKILDKLQNGIPLIDRNNMHFDGTIMAAHVRALLQILQSRTPESEGGIADMLRKNQYNLADAWHQAYPEGALSHRKGGGDIIDFLVRETLHPVLEIYAEALQPLLPQEGWENGHCPMCGEPPALAMLAGDTGKRFLICGDCATRWPFPRTACPFCRNTDQEGLSYLFIENDDKYRIDVCDACRHYLKTVDLRSMDRPVDFEVEDLITLHLDMIAMENGYTHPLRFGGEEQRPTGLLN